MHFVSVADFRTFDVLIAVFQFIDVFFIETYTLLHFCFLN